MYQYVSDKRIEKGGKIVAPHQLQELPKRLLDLYVQKSIIEKINGKSRKSKPKKEKNLEDQTDLLQGENRVDSEERDGNDYGC